jgi:hypothetical protein
VSRLALSSPGQRADPFSWEDGRMMNGSTRTKVLEERGFDIDQLTREVRITDPLTGETYWETH